MTSFRPKLWTGVSAAVLISTGALVACSPHSSAPKATAESPATPSVATSVPGAGEGGETGETGAVSAERPITSLDAAPGDIEIDVEKHSRVVIKRLDHGRGTERAAAE